MLEGSRLERLREHMSNDGRGQPALFIVSFINFWISESYVPIMARFFDVLLSFET